MALPPYIQPDLQTWLQKFRFSTRIEPRFSETDAFGHINNVSYFIYFEQGRLDYFGELRLLDHWSGMERASSYSVVADLACDYLQELFFNQAVLLKVRTASIGRTSTELEYALIREADKALIATGRGRLVNIDANTKKPTPLSSEFIQLIQSYEPEFSPASIE